MCDSGPDAMAIPFNLPSDEQTEDDYRRLDQLLLDLYQVLRQILLRPAGVQRYGNAGLGARATSPPPQPPRRARRRDLPDLVPAAPAATPAPGCPCARHRRRRRPCPAATTAATPQAPAGPRANGPALDHWLVIGEQLRKIVDEFKTTKKTKSAEPASRSAEGAGSGEAGGLKLEVRSSGLFSLLVPHALPSPVWTTVILLVGWRLLAVRSR